MVFVLLYCEVGDVVIFMENWRRFVRLNFKGWFFIEGVDEDIELK